MLLLMKNNGTKKRYYWLKLPKNFFSQKEIKKLRNIAGGDTYTVIYLKMALLSISDEGRLYYDGVEEDFASELALELDEEVENVKITITYLMSVGLLETIDADEIFLTSVPSMIGSEAASTQRSRKSRNSKKALQCNTSATPVQHQCNTEIEIEKEIDIEKEIETEIETENRVNYQLIADMYNDTCVSFPRVITLSDKRKKAIKARLKSYTEDDFKTLFEKAEASSFLKGSNNRDWSADFDWLIKDSNMAKVLEGKYDDKKAAAVQKNGFDLSHLKKNNTEINDVEVF